VDSTVVSYSEDLGVQLWPGNLIHGDFPYFRQHCQVNAGATPYIPRPQLDNKVSSWFRAYQSAQRFQTFATVAGLKSSLTLLLCIWARSQLPYFRSVIYAPLLVVPYR
jgi:hypothetical protein